MTRVAFFHNALGKTDGVSLEVDKWKICLERLGHEVFYCAGNDDAEGVYCIPELSFFHPETLKILKNATVSLTDYSEQELDQAILAQKQVIKTKLLSFIKEHQIEVLIPNNLMSVGYHIPALLALSDVMSESGLPTISHNHDFYFEDSGEVSPTCKVAQDYLDKFAPANLPNVHNLVINRLAQRALKEHKGIESQVVPNVFDFKQPAWKADDFNGDFRRTMNIGDTDLVFLQATRVMNRKGIELAIDVLGELSTPEYRTQLEGSPLSNGRYFEKGSQIILLCSGHIEEFGATASYHSDLLTRARKRGVDIRFVGNRIKHSRGVCPEGKIYSLWDTYAHADFVTYPSLWEGWGNQFIEAIFARLPVMLFEYPVYVSDLKKDNFQVVSLGTRISETVEDGLPTLEPAVVKDAAKAVALVLTNADVRTRMVETNFKIAQQCYSLEVLQEIIAGLLRKVGV